MSYRYISHKVLNIRLFSTNHQTLHAYVKKELIYAAITRAKQYLLILGDMNLLRYASNQISEKRHTMLKDRLVEPIVDSTIDDDPYKDLSPYDLMVE